MNGIDFEKLNNDWAALAHKARRTEEISYAELLEAFRATHIAFKSLAGEDKICREAFRAVMLMDEFIYYATIADRNYMGSICSSLYYLNHALKEEFFKGDYRSEFFLGPDPKEKEVYFLDIENIDVESFGRFLEGKLGGDFNDLEL